MNFNLVLTLFHQLWNWNYFVNWPFLVKGPNAYWYQPLLFRSYVDGYKIHGIKPILILLLGKPFKCMKVSVLVVTFS